jgi:hypothetical protein
MIPGWLLDRQPSANAIAVYARLAQFGKFDTETGVYEECRPRLSTLADRAAMSESTVKRAVTELLEMGAITKQLRWADDGKTSLPSVYRVIFGSLTGPGPEPGGFTGEPPANKDNPGRGGPPVNPPGVHPWTRGGSTGDLQPITSYPEGFDPEENSPPNGRTEVTTRASEAAKEEEISLKDKTRTDGERPESALDALVAEILEHLPGTDGSAVRGALLAAVNAGHSPVATRAAALSLARGEYGETKYSFPARLLSDGPWWDAGRAADARADAARLARAPRCPSHPGQYAHSCGGCAGEARAAVIEPDSEPEDPRAARARMREAVAAAAAKAKIVKEGVTGAKIGGKRGPVPSAA